MLGGGLVEQDLGPGRRSGEPEEVDGIRFTPVDVGNPHAVVEGDPAELPRIGPLLETHPRFPNRTNVQVARRVGAGEVEARVLGARRGRDRLVGHERGRGRGGARRQPGDDPLPRRRAPRPDRGRPRVSHRSGRACTLTTSSTARRGRSSPRSTVRTRTTTRGVGGRRELVDRGGRAGARIRVGQPAGRVRMLHVQCHISFDTITFARRGAETTGVDYSTVALAKGTGNRRTLRQRGRGGLRRSVRPARVTRRPRRPRRGDDRRPLLDRGHRASGLEVIDGPRRAHRALDGRHERRPPPRGGRPPPAAGRRRRATAVHAPRARYAEAAAASGGTSVRRSRTLGTSATPIALTTTQIAPIQR